MKVNRDIIKLVNFITATRRTDKKEFNGKRYIKIYLAQLTASSYLPCF